MLRNRSLSHQESKHVSQGLDSFRGHTIRNGVLGNDHLDALWGYNLRTHHFT